MEQHDERDLRLQVAYGQFARLMGDFNALADAYGIDRRAFASALACAIAGMGEVLRVFGFDDEDPVMSMSRAHIVSRGEKAKAAVIQAAMKPGES